MSYSIGQKVCLWQEDIQPGTGIVTVLKEVIVTITEIKTGVPGEFSGKPVSSQSLRGVGDDGKTYEKHWERWPESQTTDFIGQWSFRDDAEGKRRFWIPKEAVYAYDSLRLHNEQFGEEHGVVRRIDIHGQEVLPKGDFNYCSEHDSYSLPGSKCFYCRVAEMDKKTA